MSFTYTLVNLQTIVQHRQTLLQMIEHTRAKILVAHLNVECHEVTLMIKLLIVTVTQHTHQNSVNDIITHVTLNTHEWSREVRDLEINYQDNQEQIFELLILQSTNTYSGFLCWMKGTHVHKRQFSLTKLEGVRLEFRCAFCEFLRGGGKINSHLPSQL